jgi:hypothetical protein
MFLPVLSLPAWIHPCMTWGEDKIFSCQSGKMLNCLCEGVTRSLFNYLVPMLQDKRAEEEETEEEGTRPTT